MKRQSIEFNSKVIEVFADTKSFVLRQNMSKNGNELFTPVKKVKGQSLVLQQFDKAADDLFSAAVSKVRQPIESFFNYLEQKTAIQIASKVRSEARLIVHIYGKIATALLLLLMF